MFFYKVHRAGKKTMLAVCDSELLGKKFEDGRLVLDIKKEFYGGKEIGNDVIDIFHSADIINIVGDEIIKLAIKNKWISKERIIKIKGIPHAQIFLL